MEKNVLEQLSKNNTQRAIARELQVSQTTVRYWLHKFGLKTRGHKKVHLKRTCLYCGSEISYNVRGQPKFCCFSCSTKYRMRLSKEKLGQGVLHLQTLRRILINEFGQKCQICNKSRWNGKDIPIIVDHINGDPTNDSLKNLRLVCPNCDAQLPTYKRKNKGMDDSLEDIDINQGNLTNGPYTRKRIV